MTTKQTALHLENFVDATYDLLEQLHCTLEGNEPALLDRDLLLMLQNLQDVYNMYAPEDEQFESLVVKD